MGKLLILPFRVNVELPELPTEEVMVSPTELTITVPPTVGNPPIVVPPPPSNTPASPFLPPPHTAFPPIGLTDWSRDAGQRIADNISELLGVHRASYEIAVVFAVQAQHEDAGGDVTRSLGAKWNNPLNLSDADATITWPGQVGRYLSRFAAFSSLEDGAHACALNYVNGTAYAAVIDAFKANDYLRMADAIQSSPWDEGHYGGRLVDDVKNALGI